MNITIHDKCVIYFECNKSLEAISNQPIIESIDIIDTNLKKILR